MGDIPNRALFRGPVLKKCLQLYFKIVQGMSNNYSFLEAFQSKKSCNGINYAVISFSQWFMVILVALQVGEITKFKQALSTHSSQFLTNAMYTLIVRLQNNVIKTALQMISLACTRIKLKDVSMKLKLDSKEDAEYVVAKAIRDGVIEAQLDQLGRWMVSKEVNDTYSTSKPQEVFHQRICKKSPWIVSF